MESKIEKQNLVVAKVKEANDSKELQKKIQRLETRLNHVSAHEAACSCMILWVLAYTGFLS